MKTLKILFLSTILTSVFSVAYGADQPMCTIVSCSSSFTEMTDLAITNCKKIPIPGQEEWVCYKDPTGGSTRTVKIQKCDECGDDAVLVYAPGLDSGMLNCDVPTEWCMPRADAEEGGYVCPDECPSESSWTQVSTGLEAICRGGQGLGGYQFACEYRCKSGYYPTRGSSGMTKPTCTTCPTNATCDGGDSLPSCVKDYYREKDTGVGTRYKCTRCPGYYVGDTITFGQTVSAGATAKSQCYEAKGTGHVKKELKFPNDISIGKYNILQDKACFFTE